MTPQASLLKPILMVDDDKDDCTMVEKAFRKNNVTNHFHFLGNGEELLNYLQRRGNFARFDASPRPCFILLDLNMPKMDGRKALETIKADPDLRKIPVVVLTTSRAEEDIARSYDQGANSYITKPSRFEELVTVAESLKTYWLNTVELPPANGGEHA